MIEDMKHTSQVGTFISLEGTEGVGKTTAIAMLCNKLSEQGIDVVQTREPGGSELAEQLRAMLINPASDIDDATELLLMFTARSDHLQKKILPALHAGKWVVCDRFVDSSVAYQGFGRWHGQPEALARIERLIADFVPKLPDVTFWLDLPIEQGMSRAHARSQADRFETQQMQFFERVYAGFVYQHQHNRARIRRIDANGTQTVVHKRIWQSLQPFLP